MHWELHIRKIILFATYKQLFNYCTNKWSWSTGFWYSWDAPKSIFFFYSFVSSFYGEWHFFQGGRSPRYIHKIRHKLHQKLAKFSIVGTNEQPWGIFFSIQRHSPREEISHKYFAGSYTEKSWGISALKIPYLSCVCAWKEIATFHDL